MNNFRELNVWQKARVFTKDLYQLLSKYPNDEKFAIVSQMKRASVSIVSNIAEGAGRNTNNDFARFLDIALGSAFEIETQLILSNDLNFISDSELNEFESKIQEIEKMINGLIRAVRK